MKKVNRKGDWFYIGLYRFGNEDVQLVAQAGEYGGFFNFISSTKVHPSDITSVARIVIGIELTRWSEILEILHHEALEFALARMGCRFEPANGSTASSSRYLFMMTHAQFEEVVAMAAHFIAKAQRDLADVWNFYVREKKAKTR